MLHTLNIDSLKKEIRNSPKIIIVEIGARWCGSCDIMEPVLNQLALEYNETIHIGRLDIENGKQIIYEYGINTLPTYLFFRYGHLVDQIIGSGSKKLFIEKIMYLITLPNSFK